MASSSHSTASVQPTGDARIDGILFDRKWYGDLLAYGAPRRAGEYGPEYVSDEDRNGVSAPRQDFSALSGAQMAVVHAALNRQVFNQPDGAAGFSVEGFTGLELAFRTSTGEPAIHVANSSDAAAPGNTAYAYLPSPLPKGGDVWLDQSGRYPVAGNHDYHTIIHELGHALGLTHPHEDDAFGTVPAAWDSLEFSVMSYHSFIGHEASEHHGYENGFWDYPQTWMPLDIAALQHLYGASYRTNAGKTVYSWDPEVGTTFVNGRVAIMPGDNKVFMTIWDGGGIDTFDLSNYHSNLRINLNPGAASVLSTRQLADLNGVAPGGLARGNVSTALLHDDDPRSLIENVLCGSGDDHAGGNEADNKIFGGTGKDILAGYNGNDYLHGGSGKDQLYGGLGFDRLTGGSGQDYLHGGPGSDTLIGAPQADVFHFSAVSDSTLAAPDRIQRGGGAGAFEGAGLDWGDTIDVSDIDADPGTPGDQAFVLGRPGKGGLWLVDHQGGATRVLASVSDDGAADFALDILDGRMAAATYFEGDFVL